MTVGWCFRATRAAVFAAVCVLLAALGHVTMSGSHVPAWALGAGAAAAGTVGWCLAGRERGLPLIVAVVVAAQALLHSAFSLAQPAGAGPAFGSMASLDMGSLPSMGDRMGSMDMGSMPMDSVDMRAMGMSPTAHLGHSSGGTSSLGMLAAHLLAALLCGLWLACGEKAAFRILRAVAGRLAAPLRLLLSLPLTPDRPRTRMRRRRSHRAPRLLLLVHAITHRGPPVGTAVV
ncbi:hypothetical protein ACU639_02065 [Streptomyces cynarae]|uniref:hypothetical protein n=1 Tax=Streptomyces cynarae TaxID=2981134 RepID=UPI00406C39D9